MMEDKNPVDTQSRATIGPPEEHHLNGVYLVGQNWPAVVYLLGWVLGRKQTIDPSAYIELASHFVQRISCISAITFLSRQYFRY